MADDSVGKNSYHYHDAAANGVFRYAPWDFNSSFGQTWQTDREPAELAYLRAWLTERWQHQDALY